MKAKLVKESLDEVFGQSPYNSEETDREITQAEQEIANGHGPISTEEFDEFVDDLIASSRNPIQSVKDFKAFVNKHSEINHGIGEVEGHNEYEGPYKKFAAYYEENRDEIEDYFEANPEEYEKLLRRK